MMNNSTFQDTHRLIPHLRTREAARPYLNDRLCG